MIFCLFVDVVDVVDVDDVAVVDFYVIYDLPWFFIP